MNDITLNVEMMTSREIAKLTGKQHNNVLRDIERMAKELGFNLENSNLGSPIKSTTYMVEGQDRKYKMYKLDKRATITLTTGYSIKQRDAVVGRWLELETKQAQPAPLPQGSARWIDAEATMRSALALADLTGMPKHVVITETGKEIHNSIGLDLRYMLSHSKYMDDIKDDEMMLEPTELAKALDVKSAQRMNVILASLGLQFRDDLKRWHATEKGKPLCFKHLWNKEGKSGYNLKWNVAKIKRLIDDETDGGENDNLAPQI